MFQFKEVAITKVGVQLRTPDGLLPASCTIASSGCELNNLTLFARVILATSSKANGGPRSGSKMCASWGQLGNCSHHLGDSDWQAPCGGC